MIRSAFVLIVLSAFGVAQARRAPADKVLVAWSRGGHDSPAYVAAHVDWIESRPFDGMVIDDVVGRHLFTIDPKRLANLRDSTGAFTRAASEAQLAPLDRTTFRRFKTNLSKVNMGYDSNPPELFDDAGWSIVLASARHHAEALEQLGIAGIFLDNEVYTYKYWRFPEDAKQPNLGLQAYVAQSRLRGRQVMDALRSGFPAIVVVTAHGPYLGCTQARKPVIDWSTDSNLLGAFAAGIIEGAASPSSGVDGGELYAYKDPGQFEVSYDWRRNGILNPASACPFVDDSLRAVWPKQVQIGFGVYDKERPASGVGGWQVIDDPARFESKLKLALQRSDRLVWFYSEAWDWWADSSTTSRYPRPPDSWVEAIRTARAAR
jgi:hypothetical protein